VRKPTYLQRPTFKVRGDGTFGAGPPPRQAMLVLVEGMLCNGVLISNTERAQGREPLNGGKKHREGESASVTSTRPSMRSATTTRRQSLAEGSVECFDRTVFWTSRSFERPFCRSVASR
jgi:hypothetical protein